MTNVTAIVRDPSGNVYANALVVASFVGQNTTPGAGPYYGGGLPTGQFELIVPGETDSFGALAMPLLGNDVIQPSPSQWRFTVVSSTAPAVSFAVLITITGASQDISAALQAAAAPLNPATGFGNITVTGLTDTGSAAITGGLTAGSVNAPIGTVTPATASVTSLLASGNVTEIAGQNQYKAFKLDNILFVDGIKYTTIQAALNDLPATGGIVVIPPNYTEVLVANLTISKVGVTIIAAGPCTITQGAFQVVVSAGAHNFSFISPYMHGTTPAGLSQGACFIGFTGVGTAAFIVGTSAAPTYNLRLQGIQILLSNAGAGSIGFSINQVNWFELAYNSVFLGNFSAQIGFLLDGTGSFCGIATMTQNVVQDGSGSTNSIAYKEQNAVNDIDYVVGHCTLHNAGASIGLWLAGPGASSSEATLFGLAMDNCATAIKVDTTESGALDGYFRPDSTVGTVINFGAGTTANTVKCNNPGTVVDAGTNNSVIVQGVDQHNTRFWQIQQTATDYNVVSAIAGVTGAVIQIHPGGNIQIQSNAAGGAGIFLPNTGSISPNATSGSSDLGSFLPYRDLYLSPANAAANSVRFTAPGITGNKVVTVPNQTGALHFIVGTPTSQKTESAADTNVLTFTPLAVVGSYRLRFVLSVSAAAAAVLGWTATWTDSNGAAQTPTNLALFQSGAAAPALTFTTSVAGNYYGYIDIDINNAAVNIVIKFTLTAGTITAKASASIERLI